MNPLRRRIPLLLTLAVVVIALAGCPALSNLTDQPPNVAVTVTPLSGWVTNAQTTFDATNSSDPQGNSLTFLWSLVAPNLSQTMLSSASNKVVTLTPDIAGNYTVSLTVRGQTKSSSWSQTLVVTQGVGGAPTNVSAAAADSQITLSWAAVQGATSYNLYYIAGSPVTTVTTVTGNRIAGVNSGYTQLGLTNGTQYAFIVTSISGGVESAASSVVRATPGQITQAPLAPGSIQVAAGDGQVTLSWAAVSSAASYNIYYLAGTTVSQSNLSAYKISGVTSPYTIRGLTNSTQEAFVVTAVNAAGQSLDSTMVTATPQAGSSAPSAPTSLQASAGDSNVTLTWNAATSATSYNVYYKQGSAVSTTAYDQKIGNVATTGFTKQGLTNGNAYAFIVTAVNSVGESSASTVATATPLALTAAPAAPSNVTATVADSQVTISWSQVATASSYNIYYMAGTTVTKTDTMALRLTNVSSPKTVTALANGTTYAFIVTAVNSIGESLASTVVAAAPAAYTQVPSAPAISSYLSGDGQVTIQWGAVTGAIGYNVYWQLGSAVNKATGALVTTLVPSLTLQGLTNGQVYAFIVTAFNAAGESGSSAPVTATPLLAQMPPAAPTNPAASASTTSAQITLSWTPSNGAILYFVYRGTAGGLETLLATVSGGASSSYSDSAVSFGTSYFYEVSAYNAYGESPLSAEVTATTINTGTVGIGIQ